MTPNLQWVRLSPKIFLGIGVLDLLKNFFSLYAAWKSIAGSQSSLMMESARVQMQASLFVQASSALIYSATWFAYAVFAIILLGIYDRMQVTNA
ncbi:MAG: hypothetical protein AB7F98_08530 [Novosphingobium sp.]